MVEDRLSGSAQIREAHPTWLALGRFFFRHRNAVFPLVFLALVVASPARWPFHDRRWELATNVLGIAVALLGQLLRAVVIGLAYIRRGGKDRRVYAEDLVQEGIFAHCRNPLYVGNLLGLIGLLVIHNSWAGYLLGLPFFLLAYWAIVCAEEDYLRTRFGEQYRLYCQRVQRLVPSLAGLRTTLGSMKFDWRRLLRKEYGTTFSGITGILLLLIWDDVQIFGPNSVTRALSWFLPVWISLAGLYLLVRFLKKKGTLGQG